MEKLLLSPTEYTWH